MQDIDKLEKCFKGFKGLVATGEKIMADGKVDWSDSQHVPELYKDVKEIVEAIKAYKEMGEEIKDIDGIEAVKLVSMIFNK
jgi:hypothetical protein